MTDPEGVVANECGRVGVCSRPVADKMLMMNGWMDG